MILISAWPCNELATGPGSTLAYAHRVTGFGPSNPRSTLKKKGGIKKSGNITRDPQGKSGRKRNETKRMISVLYLF